MNPLHQSPAPIIMHLPVEIIRKIFLQCSLGSCQLPPRPKESRLVLTHVCSAWREVALDMPELWTNIAIRDPQHPRLSAHGHSIISTWLSRSSSRPISLQISNPPSPNTFKDLILPNLHRCRQLIYRNIASAGLQQLLLLPAGTFLNTEDIELHGWVGDQSPADIDLFGHGQVAAFQGCPKLRRVGFSFDGNPQAMDLHRLNLPWGQLSVLNLGSINPIFCLNILRECILLQECNLLISFIDNAAIDELTAISKQPVLLPSLHTLFLWATNRPTLFLDALHLPDLRTFCPTGKWDGFRWSSSSLKSFLRLDTLNLALVKLMGNDLWEFLRPFRWLTTLHLPMTGLLASTTLQGLGSGMLIPSVTSINFGQENIEGLISLLEERLIASRAAGSEINMFTLVSPGCVRPIGPAVILRLEALEAAGVRLKFSRR